MACRFRSLAAGVPASDIALFGPPQLVCMMSADTRLSRCLITCPSDSSWFGAKFLMAFWHSKATVRVAQHPGILAFCAIKLWPLQFLM